MNNKKISIWLIPLLLFIIALGVRFWGLNRHGQTWDEAAYYDGGKQYIENLQKLNFNPDDWYKNFEHPPIAKWIYGGAEWFLRNYSPIGVGKYTPGRVASACMGAMTIVLVYFLCIETFKSKRIGLVASLILIFLPTFIVHNKIMGLETPSAFFYTWAVYWFYIGLTRKKKFILLSAIPAGLVIGTRFNNGHILFFMATVILIYYFIQFKDLPKSKKFPWIAILIPIISILIVWAFWPWFWGNILDHFDLNRRFLTTQLNSQAEGASTDWFLGANVIPPWYYFIYYFIATSPIIILVLLLAYLIKYFKNIDFKKTYILVWFAMFFAMSFVGFKQDGIRYIYPILVPTAIMASYALVKLFKNSTYSYIGFILLTVYLAYSGYIYYPYYLDYYSEIFGGVNGVYKNQLFEVGWWGEGLEASYEIVNADSPDDTSVLILSCPDFANGLIKKTAYLKTYEDLEKGTYEASKKFNYVITNPAFYWFKSIENYVNIDDYQIIEEIKIQETPLVSIYKKK